MFFNLNCKRTFRAAEFHLLLQRSDSMRRFAWRISVINFMFKKTIRTDFFKIRGGVYRDIKKLTPAERERMRAIMKAAFPGKKGET